MASHGGRVEQVGGVLQHAREPGRRAVAARSLGELNVRSNLAPATATGFDS